MVIIGTGGGVAVSQMSKSLKGPKVLPGIYYYANNDSVYKDRYIGSKDYLASVSLYIWPSDNTHHHHPPPPTQTRPPEWWCGGISLMVEM